MAYKILGFAVWQGGKWYLRRRTADVARLDEELVAVREQLGRVQGQLVGSEAAREALASEAAGLRSELERLGGELARARQGVGVGVAAGAVGGGGSGGGGSGGGGS